MSIANIIALIGAVAVLVGNIGGVILALRGIRGIQSDVAHVKDKVARDTWSPEKRHEETGHA